MYSKYDDPNFVPSPGERERDRLRMLRARERVIAHELAAVREEIKTLEAAPNVLDTPLPI